MKKIISYTLYGNKPMYLVGALENSRLQKIVFPDWNCRFYVDLTVPSEVIERLANNGNEIILKPDNVKFSGLMWRFEVVFDESVGIFAIRDVDDRLSVRDASAVAEWRKSGKTYHVMRDHPNHAGYWMFGGMWGGYANKMPDFEKAYKERTSKEINFWDDMDFLKDFVWEQYVKNDHLAHDEYWKPLGHELNFPTPLQNSGAFVGNKYNEFNKPVYDVNRKD